MLRAPSLHKGNINTSIFPGLAIPQTNTSMENSDHDKARGVEAFGFSGFLEQRMCFDVYIFCSANMLICSYMRCNSLLLYLCLYFMDESKNPNNFDQKQMMLYIA